jgi:predicted ATPase
LAGFLYEYRCEQRAARQIAESLSAISEECGLSQYVAYSTILCGWEMTRQGQNKLGIAEMQKGLAASRAAGDETTRPYFLCLLAEACMETGRLDDGMTVLAEAVAAADELETVTMRRSRVDSWASC